MASKSKDEEINFLFTCLEHSKGIDLPAVARALNLHNLKAAQNRLYSMKVKYSRPGVQPKTPSKDNSSANVIANGDMTRSSPTKRGGGVKDVLSPVKPSKVTKGKTKKEIVVVDIPESPTERVEKKPVKVEKERVQMEIDSDSDDGGY